jgi:hypothetical protein
MPLDQALELRQGETVEGIENLRVVGVEPRKLGKSDQGREWCFQTLEVEQGRVRAKVKVWGFPDLSGFNGGIINVECCLNAKNEVFGVEISEYKNETLIKVDDRGLIDLQDSRDEPMNQEHNRIAHEGVFKSGGGARGQDRQQPRQEARGRAPAREQGNQRQETRQQPQRGQTTQAKTGKQTIMGVTVGMAINQANAILIATRKEVDGYFFSPDYPRDLHTIASDIYRVSDYMQEGNLAPKASKRNTPQQERRQEPEQGPIRDTDPLEPRHHDPVQEEDSYHNGLETDDIPFN